MLAHFGSIALGVLVLMLGTDSAAKGMAGALAPRGGNVYASALAGCVVSAILPATAVLLAALVTGQNDLALGGLVGGAIAQFGLVLGLAALVAPLVLRLRAFTWINPALLVVIALLVALGLDQRYAMVDGAILIGAFLIAGVVFVRGARHERVAAQALFETPVRVFGAGQTALRIVLGLVLSGAGAWLLVRGGTGLSAALGWSPLIVGLIVLGGAVSLSAAPAAMLAAHLRHGDLAVGQALVGALVNLTLLFGALVLVTPIAIPPSLIRVELPVLFALALAVYPMILSDGELSRREGGILLLAGALFIAGEVWFAMG